MSTRTEWAHARDQFITYEHHVDAYGQESDGPALILWTDECIAIEGTKAQLLAMADQIKAIVEAYHAEPMTREDAVERLYDLGPSLDGPDDVIEWLDDHAPHLAREALSIVEELGG